MISSKNPHSEWAGGQDTCFAERGIGMPIPPEQQRPEGITHGQPLIDPSSASSFSAGVHMGSSNPSEMSTYELDGQQLSSSALPLTPIAGGQRLSVSTNISPGAEWTNVSAGVQSPRFGPPLQPLTVPGPGDFPASSPLYTSPQSSTVPDHSFSLAYPLQSSVPISDPVSQDQLSSSPLRLYSEEVAPPGYHSPQSYTDYGGVVYHEVSPMARIPDASSTASVPMTPSTSAPGTMPAMPSAAPQEMFTARPGLPERTRSFPHRRLNKRERERERNRAAPYPQRREDVL